MTGADLPTVGIVFVNYHSESAIRERVRQHREGGVEIVVVDNSGSWTPRDDDCVVVVRPSANVGFGAGCNLGVAALSDDVDVVVFHNPDASLTPERLRELVGRLRRQSVPGLLAPALAIGHRIRPSGFHSPTECREAALMAWFRVTNRRRAEQTRRPTVGSGAGTVTTTRTATRFGSGALLVADRRAYEVVGGFDEAYFLYVEDADLWLRMSRAYDVGFASDVIAQHDAGSGSAASSAVREIARWIGVELYAWRHLGRRWRVFRVVHRLGTIGLRLDDGVWHEVRAAWRRRASPPEVAAALAEMMSRRASTSL